MKRVSVSRRHVLVLVGGLMSKAAWAATAVYIPGYVAGTSYSGGAIQIQGSSDRISLPIAFQGANVGFLSVVGATGNDSALYTLLSGTVGNSALLLSDPHTGVVLQTLQVNAQLSDIAYTNGKLYGIAKKANALQILSIGVDGTTQSIVNRSITSSSATWRLSGVANGGALLAARADYGSFPSTDVPAFVIDPSSLTVSTIALAGTKNNQLTDTVIATAGNSVVAIGPSPQTITSFPGGGSLGNVASSARYGTSIVSNRVSDEFSYTYLPSLPAIAETNWNATVSPVQGLQDGLTRTAQTVNVSGPITISNYVAPDATTLSNVKATTQIQQYFGSSSFESSVQNAAPGDLSHRAVAQASATLTLATGGRGLYAITSSSTITADYAYGSTVDQNRTLQTSPPTAVTQFSYEPISSNLVGNGDAAMNGAGWQGMEGSFREFRSQGIPSDPSNHRFLLTSFTNYSAEMRQFLQVPTPNSAMQLSFTYNLQSLPAYSSEIQVFLNSILLADLDVTSTTEQTFNMLITDPAFQNVAQPVLLIRGTSAAQFGSSTYIGNISLTAVPEPTLATAGVLAASMLCIRRSRQLPQ